MLYLQPFLIALVISGGVIFLVLFWSDKVGKKGIKIFSKMRGEERHIHKRNISRLGGIALILSFAITIFLDRNLVISNILWGMMLGGFVILIVGLWDDFGEIDWRWQLFFQICVISMLFIFGAKINYITNPFGGVFYFDTNVKVIIGTLITIIWALVLMNAVNWLDGIDGLSGGVSLIAIMTIFFLSLKPEVNQPPVAIIAIILAGGLVGFLCFNFYPAKIMAGTSGAFFMGFALVGLSIFAGTKIATTLLVMAVPVVDFFWVIGRRIKNGKSIFSPDQEHLHYRLLKLGWSQRKISLFFYTITFAIAILALNVSTAGKIIFVFCVGIIMLVTFYINSDVSNSEVNPHC